MRKSELIKLLSTIEGDPEVCFGQDISPSDMYPVRDISTRKVTRSKKDNGYNYIYDEEPKDILEIVKLEC